MVILRKVLFQSRFGREKSAYIWNMLAGITSAVESVLVSIIVRGFVGLNYAGIITIGYAIGNLMATVGKFGVRTFQVTEVKGKFSFASYFMARIWTLLLMLACTILYIGSRRYDWMKAVIVGLVCLRFAIEAFEDVFAAECQKQGRLDVASKMHVFRCMLFFMVFIMLLVCSHDLVVTLSAALAAVFFMEAAMIYEVKQVMNFNLGQYDWEQIKVILRDCIPLFLNAFFFFYITNAPKYAIDSVMDDEVQACYSFIAFPVFSIELLNNFIYQPVLVKLAVEWDRKEYGNVKRRICSQILVVVMLTCFVLAAGYLAGIPVLSFIFSTDLQGYKKEFLILLLGGGMLAIIGYFSTILITMRKSLLMIYGYSIVFVISCIIYKPVIEHYGVIGGTITYCILCFLYVLYEAACIFRELGNVRE